MPRTTDRTLPVAYITRINSRWLLRRRVAGFRHVSPPEPHGVLLSTPSSPDTASGRTGQLGRVDIRERQTDLAAVWRRTRGRSGALHVSSRV